MKLLIHYQTSMVAPDDQHQMTGARQAHLNENFPLNLMAILIYPYPYCKEIPLQNYTHVKIAMLS